MLRCNIPDATVNLILPESDASLSTSDVVGCYNDTCDVEALKETVVKSPNNLTCPSKRYSSFHRMILIAATFFMALPHGCMAGHLRSIDSSTNTMLTLTTANETMPTTTTLTSFTTKNIDIANNNDIDNVIPPPKSRNLNNDEGGESNVRISGDSLPMSDISTLTSLWLIPIRFVGPTAFSQEVNPVGVLRCELFARLTLQSLAAVIKSPPPRTRIKVILINASAIIEPTCAKVIERTQQTLGQALSFASSPETYIGQFTLNEDLLFISRFDSDDAVGPQVILDTYLQHLCELQNATRYHLSLLWQSLVSLCWVWSMWSNDLQCPCTQIPNISNQCLSQKGSASTPQHPLPH